VLKKNTGSQNLSFCLVNATTGAALTGATVTARRTIDGGAQASAGGSVTELGNGQYNFAPSQADTNGDLVGYLFTATNAVPVNLAVRTTAADLADAVRLGLTALPNVASGNSGAIITSGTGTAQLATTSGQVLVQAGTGAGQLDFTSGVVKANVTQFGGAAGTFASGRPEVNSTHWAGTAVGTATVRADLINIAGAAVSASTAQLGVNVVNFGGAAGTFSAGRPEVNATHWAGTAAASANVRANLTQILGTAPTEGGAGRLAGSFTTLLDVASPVLTAASVNQTGDSYARIGGTGSGLTSLAPAATALSTATWTGTLATNLATLASHDPGATLGTSTLTQAEVTGGAYALNSASFAFNAALPLTTQQKADVTAAVPTAAAVTTAVWAAGARTLTSLSGLTVDTVTTLTNLPSVPANWLTAAGAAADFGTEVGAAVLSALGTGSWATSLAPAATALSTATWTGTRAGYLDNLSAGAVATAAALATVDDFVDTEVAAIKAVTDKLDSAVELDGAVYRFTANALELAPTGGSLTAADVWAHSTRVLTAGTNIALAKGTGVTGFNDLDAAGVAGAVWNAATASYGTANTYGALVETNLDAAVTSRMATYAQPTGFLAATFPSVVASTTNITGGTITTVTNLTNAPTSGDLTAAMKASVNAEVDAALADARLDELLAADSDIDGAAPPAVGSVFHELMTKTAGSFTYDQATDSLEAVRDRGDAAWTTATGFSTHSAADVWAAGTRTLTGAANITSTGGTITVSAGAVTVGTNNDKTGYALTQTFPANFSSLSINGSGLVTLADASLTTAKLGTFALAKGTNITGFNDIAATAVVSGGAITTSSGAVSTVTAVTNRVTANTDQLAGQTVTAAAGVTFPASVGTSTYAGADTAGTTTLLSRVTATRAGYLDNLGGGAAALESTAQAVKAKTDNLPTDPADQSLLMAAVAAVETDTQDIQGRLPAALVGGRMDASAGALAAGVITDAAFTVPTLTGPATGVVGFIAQLNRRFFGKSTRDATTIKTYAADGTTVLTTQAYTASGSDETVEAAA